MNARQRNNNASNRKDIDGFPGRTVDGTTRLMPVSGSEDMYSDLTYGSPRGKNNNNCYGWAIDEYKNSGGTKLQPGNLSPRNKGNGGDNLTSCAAVTAKALADLRGRGYKPSNPEDTCRKGYYKVMAFLAPGRDHHWYKQHKDLMVRMPQHLRDVAALARRLGVSPKQVYATTPRPKPGEVVLVKDAGLWSHKQGFATGPILKDACDKAIRDPRKACRTYSKELNYTTFCGALCVASKRVKK